MPMHVNPDTVDVVSTSEDMTVPCMLMRFDLVVMAFLWWGLFRSQLVSHPHSLFVGPRD